MLKADEIIQLPDDKRRKLKLKKTKRRRRGRYNREHRPARSREELIIFLRNGEYNSTRKLMNSRQKGDPNVYDFVKEFGSWSNAQLEAFGPPLPSFNPVMDAEYVAKAILNFDLWTCTKYRKKRKQDPEIIPSFYRLTMLWGSYSNAKEYAQRLSLKKTFDRYMSFKRRLGRAPTWEECRKEGLDLGIAKKYFGSLRKMEKFVKEMETANANKR